MTLLQAIRLMTGGISILLVFPLRYYDQQHFLIIGILPFLWSIMLLRDQVCRDEMKQDIIEEEVTWSMFLLGSGVFTLTMCFVSSYHHMSAYIGTAALLLLVFLITSLWLGKMKQKTLMKKDPP